MEVGVDWNVLPEAFWRRNQGVQFDLLDWAIAAPAASPLLDCGQDLCIAERCQHLRHLRLLFHCCENHRVVDDVEEDPQILHRGLDCRPAIREG